MGASLQIYHRLPPWARNLAASARGYYLSRWRYDAQTGKLVEEALERDQWSAKQWQEWQEKRLSLILHRAATKVPFYREQWARRRRGRRPVFVGIFRKLGDSAKTNFAGQKI